MKTVLLVGAGGALGSVVRYLAGLAIAKNGTPSFPWSTFTVNVTGCFLIGLVMAWAVQRQADKNLVFFITTGFLGGFTTFSSFGLETVELLRNRQLFSASLYVSGSVILGLGAVWLGSLVYKMIGS